MSKSGPSAKSIKDAGGIKKRRSVEKKSHLGQLMQEYRELDELLFTYVTNTEMVYDEMDFTLEEFAEIIGVDVEELIEEINRAIF